MPTPPITVSIRFAAHDLKVRLRAEGRWPLATAIDSAAHAEAFPDSYTPEAVRLSERILVAAAEGQLETLETLTPSVEVMRAQGLWFA